MHVEGWALEWLQNSPVRSWAGRGGDGGASATSIEH